MSAAPPASPAPVTTGPLYLASLGRRVWGSAGLMLGSAIILTLVVLAIFAPAIAGHDPYLQDLTKRLLPPVWVEGGTWEHPFGTDRLGRDYLARLLYGARISLTIGVGAASIGALIGVTLGVCAGYFGGRVDQVVSYLLSCQLALPNILFAMALVFLIGPSLLVVIAVIGVLHWSYYLVVTRAAVMNIRELEYVTAARVSGSSTGQIIVGEVLPNLFNQIVVVFTLEMGVAVLSEASLSFLGVGIQYPTPSWGLMIAEGRDAMFFQPWPIILPGIFLFLLVLGAAMLGDGLRDFAAGAKERR
jgi:peptide/nickel transport system permease protein